MMTQRSKVTHCAGCISANTRSHQLWQGDREMGNTAQYQVHNVDVMQSPQGTLLVFPPSCTFEYAQRFRTRGTGLEIGNIFRGLLLKCTDNIYHTHALLSTYLL